MQPFFLVLMVPIVFPFWSFLPWFLVSTLLWVVYSAFISIKFNFPTLETQFLQLLAICLLMSPSSLCFSIIRVNMFTTPTFGVANSPMCASLVFFSHPFVALINFKFNQQYSSMENWNGNFNASQMKYKRLWANIWDIFGALACILLCHLNIKSISMCTSWQCACVEIFADYPRKSPHKR